NLASNAKIDIFWGSCSLPDSRGFVSLGVGACYETEMIRKARVVILELNEHMPVTYGATSFPIDKVDFFIANDHPLATLANDTPNAEDRKIAEYVTQLIPDQATIQLGIGAIPNSVSDVLKTRHGLGVHTELINDAVMELAN